jgi:hypothetical protein
MVCLRHYTILEASRLNFFFMDTYFCGMDFIQERRKMVLPRQIGLRNS